MARDENPVRAARGLAFLAGPEMPDELEYLWNWYSEIAAGRGEGMNGPAHLSYWSIDAWSRLTDTAIEPHEVRAIFMIDDAVRNPTRGEDEK